MAAHHKKYYTSLTANSNDVTSDMLFSDFVNLHPRFSSLKVYFPEMTLGDIPKVIKNYDIKESISHFDPSHKFLTILFFKTVCKFTLSNEINSSWNQTSPNELMILGCDTLKLDVTVNISAESTRDILEHSHPSKRILVTSVYISKPWSCDDIIVILRNIKNTLENLSFVSLVGTGVSAADNTEFSKLVAYLLNESVVVDVRGTPYDNTLENTFAFTNKQARNLLWRPPVAFTNSRPDLADDLLIMKSKIKTRL